jgi:hypothetical protein
VTLQAATVLMPARQLAGNFVERSSAVPAASYSTLIIVLYVLQMLMGAWIYIKYRTYVRVPVEELIVAMCLGLLPAYWYFLARASFRRLCRRAQMGDRVPGCHRLVRLHRWTCRE